MRQTFLRMALSGVVALMLAACGGGGGDGGDDPSGPSVIQVVSGNAQTGVVGTELPVALAVRVTDANARPSVGTTVTWSTASGTGTVAPATGTTDDNGTTSARWTLGTTAGAQRVSATVAGIPAAQFTATATAGAVSAVVVTSPSMQPYEGDSVQLVAAVRDEFGNVVPGAIVTWSSDDPERFPVSASGRLNTWGTGPVTVTAAIDGIDGSVQLSVVPIQVAVTFGARQVVFDWTMDRCEELDLPDLPTRMVRAENGSLVYFAGNAPRFYASRGADFDSLRRDCSQPVLVSADRRTPDSYENWEWIWTVYRIGSTWHALVHNEYHDTFAATCDPGNPSPSNPCWYNSVTHAVSTDGGHTFTKPLAPAHVIAPALEVWTPPPVPPTGRFFIGYAGGPVIRHADGHYYALVALNTDATGPTYNHVCAIRTTNLDDPMSWRAWDGHDFTLSMESPYVTGRPGTACPSLLHMTSYASLTYSTYLQRYIGLGNTYTYIDGRAVCGFYMQLSSDMVHWSREILVAEAILQGCPADPGAPGVLEPVEVIFPTFIDHADTSANFENIGRTPYLYYVRINAAPLDRDVIRVPLTLTRTN
jgi:hypothetical protein